MSGVLYSLAEVRTDANRVHVLPRGLHQYQRNHELTRDIFLVYQAPEHLFNSTEPRTLEIPLDSLAARLLGGRVQGVKEVAAAVGVADTYYFIRRFRQQFGKPPAAWLKTENGIPPQARPGTVAGHSQFLE